MSDEPFGFDEPDTSDDEYELYGGIPPHEDVDTSLEAALNVLGHVKQARARVLRYVGQCGGRGAISDEVEKALGMAHQSCSARICELEQLGSLIKTPDKRKTRRGCNARVYVVATAPLVQAPLPW